MSFINLCHPLLRTEFFGTERMTQCVHSVSFLFNCCEIYKVVEDSTALSVGDVTDHVAYQL